MTKIKIQDGEEYIFDAVRKKYIKNQPEEWVRQNIILHLNKKKGYPISLMSIEKRTEINSKNKRTDIICNDNNGNPLLLVECKAENIKINTKTINQSMMYQKEINAKFILITNGKTNYCFQTKGSKIEFSKFIPSYSEILKL